MKIQSTTYSCMVHKNKWFCYASVCFVISHFLVDSCNSFTHILHGYFTGTGAILWLPQCQWSNHEEYRVVCRHAICFAANSCTLSFTGNAFWFTHLDKALIIYSMPYQQGNFSHTLVIFFPSETIFSTSKQNYSKTPTSFCNNLTEIFISKHDHSKIPPSFCNNFTDILTRYLL